MREEESRLVTDPWLDALLQRESIPYRFNREGLTTLLTAESPKEAAAFNEDGIAAITQSHRSIRLRKSAFSFNRSRSIGYILYSFGY